MRFALLLGLIAGCGDNLVPGAQADAPGDEPVTIRVTRQSVPLAGLAVVFHSADGTLVKTTVTNIDGEASASTGRNGYVTAFTDFAANTDIKTFTGVQPGDQLVIDGPANLATPMTSFKVRVTPVAGAVFYRVLVRCLGGTGEQVTPVGNPVELTVTTTCLAPTPVLAVALDSLGLPIESVIAQASPTENGVVDLTNETAAGAAIANITLTNVGANETLESSRAYGPSLFFAETVMQVDNGTHPTVFPAGGGIASQTIAVVGARPVYVWGPAIGEQAIDVAEVQAQRVAEPLVDRATRTVTWTEAADANFVFGQLTIFAETNAIWSFSGPAVNETNSLVLPPLDVPIETATRIDIELGVGRVIGGLTNDTGSSLDELRRDGGWLDANNGLISRQRSLFQARTSEGRAGLAFTTSSLSF